MRDRNLRDVLLQICEVLIQAGEADGATSITRFIRKLGFIPPEVAWHRAHAAVMRAVEPPSRPIPRAELPAWKVQAMSIWVDKDEPEMWAAMSTE